jgi:sugar lactone lactonase YvrE
MTNRAHPVTPRPPGFDPRAVTPAGALLGESPVWDDETGRVLWVDLWGGELHTTDATTGTTTTIEISPPLSAVALTTRGTRVVTAGLCILELADDGTRHLADVPEDPCLRVNDVAVDPAGRLWLGTMGLPHRPRRAGALWRLDPGSDAPVRVVGDVTLANGIAWSPAGDTMYFVDSLRQRITAFPFDAADGSIDAGETFVDVSARDGMPDGIVVDSDGALWVALAGGSAVGRYSASGELEDRIALPVRYPTSCTFGGSDLRELFVTSGCRPADPGERAAEIARGAGALFQLSTASRGLPTNRMLV